MSIQNAPLSNEALIILRETRKEVKNINDKLDELLKSCVSHKELKNLNDKLDDLLNLTTVQGEDIKLRVDAAYAVAGLKAKTKTQGRKKTVGKNKIEKKVPPTTNYWFIEMFIQNDPIVKVFYDENDVEAATTAYETEINNKPPSKTRNREKGIARLLWRGFGKDKKACAKTAFDNWKNTRNQKENEDIVEKVDECKKEINE